MLDAARLAETPAPEPQRVEIVDDFSCWCLVGGNPIDARAHNARARGTGSWAGGSGRALADRFAYENTHLSYWAVKMMGDKLSDRTPVEEPEKSGRRA